MKIKYIFLFFFITCSFISCTTSRDSVDRSIGIELYQNDKIPKGYITYTLFLSPSSEYSRLNFSGDNVELLKKYFDDFAKDIGSSNIAIFPINALGEFDVNRSQDIIDHIKEKFRHLPLSYNDGPFIIILNHHPYETEITEYHLAVSMSFGGVSPDRIIEGLNFIKQGIRRQEIFESDINSYGKWLEVKSWLDSVDTEKLSKFIIEVLQIWK